MIRKTAALFLFLALALFAAAAPAVRFSFSSDDRIGIEGDNVVITPEDADLPRAEILPSGDLRIDGRTIATSLADRLLLVRFNQSVHSMVALGIDLGVEGAHLGLHAAAAALVGLLTGDEDAAKHEVEPRAGKMKAKARALCREMRTLFRIQEQLAHDVPAFRPYAALDGETGHCHVDD